jgi:hypothetical protein
LQVHAAEQDTVQAIIPWEANGRVYQVDTGTMMFLGAFTGVMYIESSQGEMHEALVMCPICGHFGHRHAAGAYQRRHNAEIRFANRLLRATMSLIQGFSTFRNVIKLPWDYYTGTRSLGITIIGPKSLTPSLIASLCLDAFFDFGFS